MGFDKLSFFGDSELVIHQVKNNYKIKQQRLKQYKNEAWDFVENLFLAFDITFVQRNFNQQAYSLSLAASNFKTMLCSNLRYEIEVKCQASIPDNI